MASEVPSNVVLYIHVTVLSIHLNKFIPTSYPKSSLPTNELAIPNHFHWGVWEVSINRIKSKFSLAELAYWN